MTEPKSIHILDSIPFQPDLPMLMQRLRIKEGSANEREVQRLLVQAAPIARPRVLVMEAYVTERGEDWVEIDGVRFDSRVLSVNLQNVHRVFPYLATCGTELQEWAEEISTTCDDMLLTYWAEAIKEAALYCATLAMNDLLAHIHPGKMASMNPGSLTDWPIQQQQVLFGLFGAAKDRTGVQLTDSMLMVPTKSVSGIHYPTEIDFASCQLCPRENCPNRRAPYDPHLYYNRYCANESSTA